MSPWWLSFEDHLECICSLKVGPCLQQQQLFTAQGFYPKLSILPVNSEEMITTRSLFKSESWLVLQDLVAALTLVQRCQWNTWWVAMGSLADWDIGRALLDIIEVCSVQLTAWPLMRWVLDLRGLVWLVGLVSWVKLLWLQASDYVTKAKVIYSEASEDQSH